MNSLKTHGQDMRDPRTHAVIGAAVEVHQQLGAGFAEPVYQEALSIELSDRGIAFAREIECPIVYKGRWLGCTYRPDFVCFDSIIVELKALKGLSGTEAAQVINYLKATSMEVGLLLNFGTPSLGYKRFCLSRDPRLKSAKSADDSSSVN